MVSGGFTPGMTSVPLERKKGGGRKTEKPPLKGGVPGPISAWARERGHRERQGGWGDLPKRPDIFDGRGGEGRTGANV